MGELVGAWWNGRWSRLARRDVRLEHEPERWVVQARLGGPDGELRSWEFSSEADARAMVERCIAAGGDGWNEITKAYTAQQELREHRRDHRP